VPESVSVDVTNSREPKKISKKNGRELAKFPVIKKQAEQGFKGDDFSLDELNVFLSHEEKKKNREDDQIESNRATKEIELGSQKSKAISDKSKIDSQAISRIQPTNCEIDMFDIVDEADCRNVFIIEDSKHASPRNKKSRNGIKKTAQEVTIQPSTGFDAEMVGIIIENSPQKNGKPREKSPTKTAFSPKQILVSRDSGDQLPLDTNGQLGPDQRRADNEFIMGYRDSFENAFPEFLSTRQENGSPERVPKKAKVLHAEKNESFDVKARPGKLAEAKILKDTKNFSQNPEEALYKKSDIKFLKKGDKVTLKNTNVCRKSH
jgi:hypothetical protein